MMLTGLDIHLCWHPYNTAKSFSVTLRIIPARIWSPEALTRVDFLSLPSISGHLDVNLEIVPTLKGAFKTAHPGSITSSSDEDLPPSLSGNVCVKQVYFSGKDGVVKHYCPLEEQPFIHYEVGCLDWSRILLNLTYQFIEVYEEDHGKFPGTILRMWFVEAAIAECDNGKLFLIEEWISTSETPFMKYINNAHAVSCVCKHAPVEMQNIANFLCLHSMFNTRWPRELCSPLTIKVCLK